MKLEFPMTFLALALCAAWGSAQAADTVVHNDLDGDGRSDLIWRNASTGAIVYWPAANATRSVEVQVASTYNTPAGFDLARSTVAFACTLWSVSVADLLVENGKGDLIGMLLERRPGSYVAYEDSAVSTDWKLVGVGDFNNSSYKQDLVFRNRRDGSNMIGFWDWDGRRFVQIARVADAAWNIAGIGDFDGDGKSDILWHNTSDGRNAIWKSGNSATAQAVTRISNLAWIVAGVADFDGDGKSDILWHNNKDGRNTIWRSGNPATAQALTTITNLAWIVAGVADFNGDGKSDIHWRNSRDGRNTIWKSANAATPQALPTVALSWSAVM